MLWKTIPQELLLPALICSVLSPGPLPSGRASTNAPFHCSRQEFCASSASAVSSALPLSEHSQGFKAKLPHFPTESSKSTIPTKSRSGLNLRFQLVLKSELKFSPKSQAPQVTHWVNQMPVGQVHSNQAFLHVHSCSIPALTTWQVVPEQELLRIPNSGSALPATQANRTPAKGNSPHSLSEPGRVLFPSQPRSHRKALKKARSNTKAVTPTARLGCSATSFTHTGKGMITHKDSQYSCPKDFGKRFSQKVKKHPKGYSFIPNKALTGISRAGKPLEETELPPKGIGSSCSEGSSCLMFSRSQEIFHNKPEDSQLQANESAVLQGQNGTAGEGQATLQSAGPGVLHRHGTEPESKARGRFLFKCWLPDLGTSFTKLSSP